MAAAPSRRPKSPAYPGSFPPRPGKIHPISPPCPAMPRRERGTLHHCPAARIPTKLVIANQCAHWRGNPRPRRETRQAGTTLGKSVALSRIRPKYCFLSCPAAGNADCHVAALLAMTMGGDVLAPAATPPPSACHRKPRTCNRAHLPAFCLPPQTTSLHPRTPTRLQHVIASQCAHWCGNPRPRREAWQVGTTSGKSAALSRIRPKYSLSPCAAAGLRIATSLRSSQ